MNLKPIRMFAIIGAISLLAVPGVFAADAEGLVLHGSVESVDKTTKTITLNVDSPHDITAFISHGDEVEIVIEEGTESLPSGQKRSWRMQRKRPMVPGK